MKLKSFRFFIIFTVFFTPFFTGCEVKDVASIGKNAPVLNFSSLKGQNISLRGEKVSIIRFWQSSCDVCIEEMPLLEEIYKQNIDNIEMIAINVKDSKEEVEKFIKKYKISYKIVLDESGDIADKFGVIGIPTTFVTDTNGIIRDKIIGAIDEKKLIIRAKALF